MPESLPKGWYNIGMHHTQTQTRNALSDSLLGRWAQFAVGILLLALGITLMVRAQAGLGPWDVLHQGVSMHTGMALGTVTIVVGLLIMAFWLPLGERPGLGTICNILFVGLLVNGFMAVIPPLTPEVVALPWLWPARLTQMVAGVVLLGMGAGLYISTGLGAGPRDGVMMGLVRHTGWSIRAIRTLMEVSALIIGWLLGGTVGIGTLVLALLVGPVIQATIRGIRWWKAHHAQ
jgi:uncharacterized membrane protein YczE